MEHLCAPWRSDYFNQKRDICPFCDVIKNKKDDEKNGILFRSKLCFGIMNLFPYNPGHFMILPYKHIDNIETLDLEIWQEMSHYVRLGVGILKKHLCASGVNIGMNLGQIAGAGIAQHVHYHLIPRYLGDTNFISTISDLRVNGQPFYPLYEKIRLAFND